MRFSLHSARRFSYSARAISSDFDVLAQRLAQTIEKGAIILQFDRVHRSAEPRRGIAHVIVAIGIAAVRSWRSRSATLRPASAMARLRSLAEVEAISWIGSKRLDLVMGCRSHYRPVAGGRRRELRHELPQIRVTALDSDRFVHVLAQEFDHFGPLLHRQIHARIGAAAIGADGDQIAVLLIGRIHLLEAIREIELLARRDLMHGAADGGLDVDGRIQPVLGQPARQHDVAVEDGARRVGDRIVLIVAFRQHRIERRDRSDAAVAVAGALDQLRQPREHRGRIALGRRRLADGERDLALRLREARQESSSSSTFKPAVAEILRDGGGEPGAVQPHQRRIVGGRRDHHRAPHAVRVPGCC